MTGVCMPRNQNENRWKDPEFKTVLSIFEDLSALPRCSKNESYIASRLEKFGRDRALETKRDHCNNVVIRVPGTSGLESAPTVILQAHMDMVCEKEAGTVHNFAADGIKLVYTEENGTPYLTADKTTLGADNGIGMAYALAVADQKHLPHPPLELLFTTDEEIGLTGAQGMLPDFVSGDYMINLDSEEEGVIIVGCAGGAQLEFKRLITVEDVYDENISEEAPLHPFTVVVSGLLGGHSGTDIHIGRGNANQILIHFFVRLHEKYPQHKMKLIKIKGGTAANTIPRRAELSFLTTMPEDELRREAADYAGQMKNTPGFNDPGLTVEISVPDVSSLGTGTLKSFSVQNTERIMNFLSALPNGVFEMSSYIPDLVLVSGNLATIQTKSSAEYFKGGEKDSDSDADIYTEKSKRELEIIYSLRSGNEAKMKEKMKELMAFAEKHHFIFGMSHTYAPWEPAFETDFLKKCAAIYQKTFGTDVQITAIHAGLECGVFHRLFPDMNIISIGPDITGAHTPDEKLNLEAAEKVWIYLKEILSAFAKAND